MQSGSMNKLAQPHCTQCKGLGEIRVPRSLNTPRTAKSAGQGFVFVRCEACKGAGQR